MEVTENDLRDVMTHIEKLTSKSPGPTSAPPAAVAGSSATHLQLSFVMKEAESLKELKTQLRHLVLAEAYRLVNCDRESNLYYATSKPERWKKSQDDDATRDRLTAFGSHVTNEGPRSQSFSGFSNVLKAKRQSLLLRLGKAKVAEHASMDDMAPVEERPKLEVEAEGDVADRRRRWSDAKGGEGRGQTNAGASFLEEEGKRSWLLRGGGRWR